MIPGAELSSVLRVSALCASILVLAETMHKGFAVEPEWTRKLVHVLMGLTAAAFPWLLGDPRSVLVICGVFGVILGLSLVSSGLTSVHGVGRRTGGVLWFSLGVAVVYVVAEDRPDLYAISVLVLTLADPAAAMVGRRYGAHRFRVGRDAKTIEGSLAFLMVAFGCLFIALRLTASLGATESIVRALWIGALLAGIEAVSPAGSDNLTVPLGALLLLRATEPDGAAVALATVVFLSVVAVMALEARYEGHRERARA
jgi:phytol kinase